MEPIIAKQYTIIPTANTAFAIDSPATASKLYSEISIIDTGKMMLLKPTHMSTAISFILSRKLFIVYPIYSVK